jgi:hypothetical protein
VAQKNFVVKNGLSVGTLEIIDSNGNITANSIAGAINNANLGNTTIVILTVTGNTALGNVALSGDIVPSANVTYNLGSPEKAFKDLYLAGSTITLGGIKLQDTGAALDVVTAGNQDANVKISSSDGILVNGNRVATATGQLDPDAAGQGFRESTVFEFPTGDLNGVDTYVGETSQSVDPFGVLAANNYTMMEPVGRIRTQDLGDLT